MAILDALLIHLSLFAATLLLWVLLLHQTHLARHQARNLWLEGLCASFSALALVSHPVVLPWGLPVDLHLVPIALLGLRGSPVHVLLAAAPAVLYQLYQEGGVVPAVLPVLVLAGLLWVLRSRGHPLKGSVAGWWLFLGLLPSGFLLSSGEPMLLLNVLLWYLTSVGMFLLGLQVLHLQEALLSIREGVSRASLTDPLTGLGNRRKLMAEHRRFQNGQHLLSLQISGFKALQDHYGQQVADEILATLGTVIHESLGNQHQGYRLDREHFLVVLTNKTEAEASQWAGEIALMFSERVELFHPQVQDPVTASTALVHLQAGDSLDAGLVQAGRIHHALRQQGQSPSS